MSYKEYQLIWSERDNCFVVGNLNDFESQTDVHVIEYAAFEDIQNELYTLNEVYRMNREYIEIVKSRLLNQGYLTELDIKNDMAARTKNEQD